MPIEQQPVAIKIESVSLGFHLRRDRARSIKEALVRKLLSRESESELFWALQEVSLTIQRGERVALIGLNGSGKTTLLSLVAGIYQPDKGRVFVAGRVVGLLGLGVGFDPEMTGRENIFLNASLYGISRKEILKKIDAIIDFADIGEFIDTPVKIYSSGMGARLGFAVAAHLDADILLLDEVLAVGDVEFQQKCLARMSRLKEENKTMLFVSHNLGSVNEMCQSAIWMEHGRVIAAGPVKEITQAYQARYAPGGVAPASTPH